MGVVSAPRGGEPTAQMPVGPMPIDDVVVRVLSLPSGSQDPNHVGRSPSMSAILAASALLENNAA
ncbi:hypothetical protein [Ferrimicrobium acidiphilum]|uniref:hypothetical protein n=1 Tax=Ferrimicrobium acidiphilum TaxID=121039 RepID=UPI0023F42802|nr:hypothetical protein [Ferrimicrobium acidiphilum]